MTRLATLCLAALAALVVSGCGNKVDTATVGETEGIYVGVDDLTYQVQISRILNPASHEDQAYLRGLPEEAAEPAADEVWFGIFLRVENESDQELPAAEEFRIHDTQEHRVRADRARTRRSTCSPTSPSRSRPACCCRSSTHPPRTTRSRARCCCSR